MTEDFRGFIQTFQVLKLGHDRFLSEPFYFIIYWSLYHSTICIPRYWIEERFRLVDMRQKGLEGNTAVEMKSWAGAESRAWAPSSLLSVGILSIASV
jgi:hypothetical protein